MTEKKKSEPLDLSKQKHPIDMTSDELLDYTIAPEIAERLREIARSNDAPEDCEPDGDSS
ncbi:MAG: hypothetical protein AUG51_08745 [Acidobacteria bacterium 13_1_20CM_3_53_8]|nr:MAG: hypothetical protein AUG51_08745 [Acidobacteria bacterium 13_1_20CM_3_53_8]